MSTSEHSPTVASHNVNDADTPEVIASNVPALDDPNWRDRHTGEKEITLTQPTREDSEKVLDLLANDLLFIYGISRVKNVLVPADDSLRGEDKNLEKFYDLLREDYGLVDGSRIITTYSFIDSNRMINMFIDRNDVPVMIIDDRTGIRNDIYKVDFFSHPLATYKDVIDFFNRWSHDIRV